MFWFQVLPVPLHGMGLTMEGRAHPLCHVGSFMSRHHKARCMEGAATMQVHTTHTMHHTSHITQFSIHLLCRHCPRCVPVRFTRPHGMVTNHMGGWPPPRRIKKMLAKSDAWQLKPPERRSAEARKASMFFEPRQRSQRPQHLLRKRRRRSSPGAAAIDSDIFKYIQYYSVLFSDLNDLKHARTTMSHEFQVFYIFLMMSLPTLSSFPLRASDRGPPPGSGGPKISRPTRTGPSCPVVVY